MAPTVTRLRDFDTNQIDGEIKPQPTLHEMWRSAPRLPQEKNRWVSGPVSAHASLSPPPNPPPIQTLLYRLPLKGLNLVSRGRECTRWLTCLWRSLGDMSWCHVAWHMLTSVLYLCVIRAFKPQQYLRCLIDGCTTESYNMNSFFFFFFCSQCLCLQTCVSKRKGQMD